MTPSHMHPGNSAPPIPVPPHNVTVTRRRAPGQAEGFTSPSLGEGASSSGIGEVRLGQSAPLTALCPGWGSSASPSLTDPCPGSASAADAEARLGEFVREQMALLLAAAEARLSLEPASGSAAVLARALDRLHRRLVAGASILPEGETFVRCVQTGGLCPKIELELRGLWE